MRKLWVSVMVFALLSTNVHAQSDSFEITTLIGDDTVPPTVPLNVLATPASSSAITVTWDASTDVDSAVLGYQVFRDNFKIATTAALSYLDSSLSASTTYDYNVTAFDLFNNISARSATTSTSTLQVTVVTPTSTATSSGGGATFGQRLAGEKEIEIDAEIALPDVTIGQLAVSTETTEAQISLTTSERSYVIVRYGLTADLEIGYVVQSALQTNHEVLITGLLPGINYFYAVEVIVPDGRRANRRGSFVTMAVPTSTVAPANVQDLKASTSNKIMDLTWSNPDQETFEKVRVVANEIFYPTDQFDGVVIYEGDAERAKYTLEDSDRVYFTVFTYDRFGNVSSGAVLEVELVTSIDVSDLIIDAKMLDLTDVQFIQDYSLIETNNRVIALDAQEVTTIRIPYELFPKHLKIIKVTLQDPVDSTKTFSFLLRANEEKTFYSATIGALETAGQYPFVISYFDLKRKETQVATGSLEVSSSKKEFRNAASTHRFASLWPLATLFVLLILFTLRKRKRTQKGQI